jgi:hypothetical protein
VLRVRRLLLTVALLAGSSALAADIAPALQVTEAKELRVGERAFLEVTLELPADAASPLLVTQTVEGEAVEVVRGRLMRKDARDPEATPLRFDIPLLARAPGTSIVRVHALIYPCSARGRNDSLTRPDACAALELEKRVSVVVLAR